MNRKIKQIRYYGPGHVNNEPPTIHKNILRSGGAFSEYTPIIQLGIQGIPGTKFYLNDSASPVIIGATGIYELDVSDYTQITGLSFDLESLNMIDNSATPSTAYLIVDIIYEGAE